MKLDELIDRLVSWRGLKKTGDAKVTLRVDGKWADLVDVLFGADGQVYLNDDGDSLWLGEPPKGGMFIWAYWDAEKATWATGLGYWTVTPGQWRDAYNWNGNYHELATHFLQMPEPPRG